MKTVKFLALAAIIFCRSFAAVAQTWTQTSAPTNNWYSVASSVDGSKLVAVIFGGGIYTSTDWGNTWTQTSAPTKYWYSVASSTDGSKLVAGGGSIYTSKDSGNTWTSNNVPNQTFPNQYWTSVASSADGSKLVAVSHWGDIYSSTNWGIRGHRTMCPTKVGLPSLHQQTEVNWW